jgi:uncharacterized protein (TIGR03083 family)
MLDASSISMVLDVYRPERRHLLELLRGLSAEQWGTPTECPAYTVKGIATHVLGDDLSLLSRQRDAHEDGVSLLAREIGPKDFATLLDAFNDRWVGAAAFLSPELLSELLDLAGEWTAAYYEAADPTSPGEPVTLFGDSRDASAAFWHAIAREYLERWIHHSQIRRALGLGSLAEREFLVPGFEVAAAIARMEPTVPSSPDEPWSIGPVVLGDAQQAADILTRGRTAEEIERVITGPAEMVTLFAAVASR